MPRQVAKVGDVFWVPIGADAYVLGQIVEIEKAVLNSICCALFDQKSIEPEMENFDLSSPFSVQFVTKDLFNAGVWERVCNSKVIIPDLLLPYREAKKNDWIGVKVIGSGIIIKFLSAYYGLRDWAEMHDPQYYQHLLLPGASRPESV